MKMLLVAFFVSAGLLVPTHSFGFVYDTHAEQCSIITGKTREQFFRERGRGDLFFKEGNQCVIITNPLTKIRWVAGIFNMYTVEQLAAEVATLSKDSAHKAGRLNVVYAQNSTTLPQFAQKKINIAALQADPHNAGAIFQVFTGTDCKTRVADGHSSLNAAVSAAPGAIIRHHYLPEIDLAGSVACFEECFRSHGYVSLAAMHNTVLTRVNAALNHRHMGIGVHLDAAVAFDIDEQEIKIAHVITQIFTTRIDLANNKNKDAAQNIGRKVILAAYQGTMHAAAIHGEQRLFEKPRSLQQVFITLPNDGKDLTDDEFTWIQEALADCIPLIGKYSLDVTLIVPSTENPGAQDFLTFVQELTEISGGSFKEITKIPTSPIKRKGHR